MNRWATCSHEPIVYSDIDIMDANENNTWWHSYVVLPQSNRRATDNLSRFDNMIASNRLLTGMSCVHREHARYREAVRQHFIAKGYNPDAKEWS